MAMTGCDFVCSISLAMKFKRGSIVEVMNKRGDPVSWRMAEILSVNGHTYDVRYGCFPGNATQTLVERVKRKFVRPCPPLVEGLENCIAGGIVEVFDDCSWKIAMILKVLNGDQYLVRLLGCSQELIINRSNVRMRQTWHNDKWILMEKGPRGRDDGKASELLTSDYYQKMSFQTPEVNTMDNNPAQKYCTHIQSDAGVRESHLVSSRSLKRMSPYCSSVIEAHNGHVLKIRAIEKEETKNRVVSGPVIEKGHSWRHASIASKGLMTDVRVCRISLGTNYWTIQSSTVSQILQTYRPVSAIRRRRKKLD
ncbi:Plant Tudor-like RNA-binding protein [Forsythia ovata]|uniref:Plant Tudor-like RNA-binding protein n=1 Tax=Forsythia ovata TaxID=205694 RepID=A0ABD1W4Y5_9LAMI